MYVKLKERIEIFQANKGSVSFYSFHSIELEPSIDKRNSSCTIKIPTSGRLQYEGEERAGMVNTATYFGI